MDEVRCGNKTCNKIITTDTEIEYSRNLGEYFCNAECATDRYFDYMESTPLDIEELSEKSEEVLRGKTLYYKS